VLQDIKAPGDQIKQAVDAGPLCPLPALGSRDRLCFPEDQPCVWEHVGRKKCNNRVRMKPLPQSHENFSYYYSSQQHIQPTKAAINIRGAELAVYKTPTSCHISQA
jgi:hypothetical protein